VTPFSRFSPFKQTIGADSASWGALALLAIAVVTLVVMMGLYASH